MSTVLKNDLINKNMKNIRKSEVIIFLIVVAAFAIGAYFYPQMPANMASHWNANGQVDGYMSKFWGLFLMPIISLAMLLLFIIIPRIDPLKENIAKFRKHFDAFLIAIFLFLLYIYLLTIFWSLGGRFNMNQALSPAFAILFFCAGILIEKSKRNYFIGIRTPWTLASEKVWDKTHKLGGKLFKASAIICLLGLFFPNYAVWLLLVPVIFSAVFSFIYSYIEFRKE